MQAPDVASSFHSLDGEFTLTSELRLDRYSENAAETCTITFTNPKKVGTFINPPALETLLAAPPRFVDIPFNGDDKGSFSLIQKDKSKSKKVKGTTSKTATSTSFVTRAIAREQLATILEFRHELCFMLVNMGRTVALTDFPCKSKEPLAVLNFRDASVTAVDCYMVNSQELQTIIGFDTGDILAWFPVPGKFARMNKQGLVNRSGVTSVKWMPPGPRDNCFVAGFEDGSVVIFEKDKDDPTSAYAPSSAPSYAPPAADDNELFSLIRPFKLGKHNPCGYWQVGRKAISAICFSPDTEHVAIASLDGHLRIIHFVQEKLVETYRTYYGGITCIDYSPDGKYILTGGQDDIVTIWQIGKGVVARCHGHSSWVSGVAFESMPPHDNRDSYRFASIGEDLRLFLWEFSLAQLNRPPKTSRKQVGETEPLTNADGAHPVLSRFDVPTLAPLEAEGFRLHHAPLSALCFGTRSLITADRQGFVRIWTRLLTDREKNSS
ncbi:WD40-repeat-containing domain protein [Fimicolochytrium jonesii]|uniref:WD40-repeat-containing domain protein n=1 Tax=Fimicolochytrium jonesii TaxID=1396493 RepID=UPI0022FE871C|nr:WD40-repeat-containing domain protein [Fimicolochytrium jonesii]KAI8816786.1 WD40-repeat-containing domain protein [Fimicolochytrium jonesii]